MKKGSSSASLKSKSTKKVAPPSVARKGSSATMYKCDKTSAKSTKSYKTTTGGFSFAGKTVASNGRSVASNVQRGGQAFATPVISHHVDKPIGGAVGFSQLDEWVDNSLNKRASGHLMVCNGVIIEEDELECRPSGRHENLLVFEFPVSTAFTNPDEKLEYLLDRIAEVYPNTGGDPQACLSILQNHPRYISAKMNLKNWLGRKNEIFMVDIRIQCPFKISEELVTQDEDPCFYGFEIKVDEETGETHIYFELKEKGHEFEPVQVDGEAKKASSGIKTTPKKSSMMKQQRRDTDGLNPIPESITYMSPAARVNETDDESTIKTQDQNEWFKTAGVEARSHRMPDVHEEEQSWDENLGEVEMDIDEDANDPDCTDEDSEVERLREQLLNLQREHDGLKDIVTGVFASRSRDSDESNHAKSTAGATKKKRTNEGSASIAGSKASRHSEATRGTQARDNSRKQSPGNLEDGKKDR